MAQFSTTRMVLEAPRPEKQDWESLSVSERDARFASLGLYYNKLEPALICKQCKYALKPSGETVTRHLGEKHGISASARRGLSSFVSSLRLPDPNQLPTPNGPTH